MHTYVLMESKQDIIIIINFHAVVADAIVFVILLLLDKPLPTWLYPFVFYIQVIDLTIVIIILSNNYVSYIFTHTYI